MYISDDVNTKHCDRGWDGAHFIIVSRYLAVPHYIWSKKTSLSLLLAWPGLACQGVGWMSRDILSLSGVLRYTSNYNLASHGWTVTTLGMKQ